MLEGPGLGSRESLQMAVGAGGTSCQNKGGKGFPVSSGLLAIGLPEEKLGDEKELKIIIG